MAKDTETDGRHFKGSRQQVEATYAHTRGEVMGMSGTRLLWMSRRLERRNDRDPRDQLVMARLRAVREELRARGVAAL